MSFKKEVSAGCRFYERGSLLLAFLFLGFLGSEFFLFLLGSTLSLGSGEEIKAVMGVTDTLDISSGSELLDERTCNGTVHLKLFD